MNYSNDKHFDPRTLMHWPTGRAAELLRIIVVGLAATALALAILSEAAL